MVASVTNVDGVQTAVHRTFFNPCGQGKAPIEPNKMTLGPIGGCAIRLAPLAEQLLVGEGIESTLAGMMATGQPGWAASSAVGLRSMKLPPEVRSVIILADGDPPGIAAAEFAERRCLREGRAVRIAYAPSGKDFADLLLEKGS